MFRPNTHCHVLAKQPVRTIHGKETFGAPVRVPCSIVHLRADTGQSSVRADQSATRGAADQTTAAAKFLVPPKTRIVLGDAVRMHGQTLEVIGIEQRFDVRGGLNHLEVVADLRTEI